MTVTPTLAGFVPSSEVRKESGCSDVDLVRWTRGGVIKSVFVTQDGIPTTRCGSGSRRMIHRRDVPAIKLLKKIQEQMDDVRLSYDVMAQIVERYADGVLDYDGFWIAWEVTE